jgi:hypothetical protein
LTEEKTMKAMAVLLALLFFGGSVSAQTNVPVPEVLIQELTGTVEIRPSELSEWIPARVGMRLERSSIISTGLQSSAVLQIGLSKIMVRPLTRLSIEELSALRDTEQVGLFLRTGKVRAEVTPPPNGRTDFSVRSPQAVNSVRGTVFEFDTVHLTVEEGRVWFVPSAGGGAALVRSGESSAFIEAAATVSSPHAIIEALRPELPPGTENGVVMPPSAPSAPGPAAPPPDIDAEITVGW